jgi:hypothetical protein
MLLSMLLGAQERIQTLEQQLLILQDQLLSLGGDDGR